MVLTHPDFTVTRPSGLSVEITDAEWWLWLRLHELEPTSQLGGILAWKRGFHGTGDYNRRNFPGDYSIRDEPNRTGPWWQWKASALDWTFPEAHSRDYRRIAKYMQRLLASARDSGDPRLRMVLYEFFGQGDNDDHVEGFNLFRGVDATSDISHWFHIHFSLLRSACGDFWAMWALLTVLMGWTVAQWRASLPGGVHPGPSPSGGNMSSNFMIQKNGDPTIWLSNGFECRELSDWNDFLFYRDTLKWPYVVVADEATFTRRAGRYWTLDEQVTAPALLTDDQMARIEAAARAGAQAGGAIPADVLRQIMDDEAISLEEIQDAVAAANGTREQA